MKIENIEMDEQILVEILKESSDTALKYSHKSPRRTGVESLIERIKGLYCHYFLKF